MMWIPSRAAFRGGQIQEIASTPTLESSYWDPDSIGYHSFAFGHNVKAKGQWSVALGNNSYAGEGAPSWSITEPGNTEAPHGSIAIGHNNISNGIDAVAMGGLNNTVTGDYSVVMGEGSFVQGNHSLAFGHSVTANTDYAVVLGRYATSNGKDGCLVFGDNSIGASLVGADFNDQFITRTAGGVRFYTNAGLTSGTILFPGGGSWVMFSDSSHKRNIRAVSGDSILAKIARLSIPSWSYVTQDTAIRHIGPMAQDFHSLFGFGEDTTGITTSDAIGVCLLAIKSLEQRMRNMQSQSQVDLTVGINGSEKGQNGANILEEVKAENAELRQENHDLRERIHRIEELLKNMNLGADQPDLSAN